MKKQQSVTLCGETLTGPRHICAFFDSRDEQYEVLLPYFKEGLDNNEEVVNIREGHTHSDHCCRLSDAGMHVQDTLTTGQLKVLASEETYLRGDHFASERMYNMVEQVLMNAKNGPYDAIRACGDMEWALKNLPGTDELIEYETRLNLLTPKYECTVLCIYDVNRFSARVITDVLASHSHVILNGRIHKNPHFIDPMEFLQTLLRRPKRMLANAK